MTSEPPRSHDDGKKESDKQDTSPNPTIPPSSVESHPQVPQHRHNAPCKKHRDGWDRFKYGMEILGLVSLIFYTVFGGCQLRVANQTLTEIKTGSTDTHNLALAARDQWNRMGQQNLIGKQFLGGGPNRPWIGIEEPVRLTARKAGWEVAAILKNYGAVPARRVTSSYFLKTGADVPRIWNDYLFCDSAEDRSKRLINLSPVIWPNRTTFFTKSVDLVDPDFANSSQRWLLMCVAYQDNYVQNESVRPPIDPDAVLPPLGHVHATKALYFWDGKILELRGTETY